MSGGARCRDEAELAAMLARGGATVATHPLARTATEPRNHGSTVPPFHGPVKPWVDPLLLAVLGEPRKLPVLTGEDALQALIVHNAREGARAGRWSVLCVMRRNDIRVRAPTQGQLEASPGLAAWGQRQKREAQREGARAAALGLIRGFTDLDVIWPGGVGYLEVKMPGAYPSPEQRAVHALLRGWGHRVETVRGWPETLDVWRRWGVPGVGA